MKRIHGSHHSIGTIRWPAGIILFSIVVILFSIVSIVSISFQKNEIPDSSATRPSPAEKENSTVLKTDNRNAKTPQTAGLSTTEGSLLSGLAESDIDIDAIRSHQKTALEAAITAKPVDDSLSERPAFVSQIEWNVLNEVSAIHAGKNDILPDLLNKLLFFKKREIWQTLSSEKSNDTARQKLATELLEMLPDQVENRSISSEFAAGMEQALKNDIAKIKHLSRNRS